MALLLGPILRHVDATTASVWVQTDRPAEVEVLGCRASTFEVAGFHYALVRVTGLTPDATVAYEVTQDGATVWPDPGSAFPPSIIRTRGPNTADRLRVIFGSCRYPRTGVADLDDKLGVDALDAYATAMATRPTPEWPDVLILLGDQVYADELTPQARAHLAGRRQGSVRNKRPADEVVSYSEYEGLYRHTWGDPEIRWILSTVPTAMIFDDHDIRDDWNTSATWRAQMNELPWWRDRIRSGLAAYWVYQHLGNLSPTELDADPDCRRIVNSDTDIWPLLVDLADRADADTAEDKGLRFSYRWDLGRNRLIMIDSRNGRVLTGDTRKMLSDREFAWLSDQATDDICEIDHLILGSSLPWLLPPAVADLQSIDEALAARPGLRGRLGEKIRQAADFEHWPAFFESFVTLSALITGLARDRRLASITVLSGDVHHSYAARAEVPVADNCTAEATPVYQLVCSPVHNHVPAYVRPVFRFGWSRGFARVTRTWARRLGVPAPPLRWSDECGPLFGNTIATLTTGGRTATVTFFQPDGDGTLSDVAVLRLTD